MMLRLSTYQHQITAMSTSWYIHSACYKLPPWIAHRPEENAQNSWRLRKQRRFTLTASALSRARQGTWRISTRKRLYGKASLPEIYHENHTIVEAQISKPSTSIISDFKSTNCWMKATDNTLFCGIISRITGIQFTKHWRGQILQLLKHFWKVALIGKAETIGNFLNSKLGRWQQLTCAFNAFASYISITGVSISSR